MSQQSLLYFPSPSGLQQIQCAGAQDTWKSGTLTGTTPITGKSPLFNFLAENMAQGRCFQAVPFTDFWTTDYFTLIAEYLS